MIIAPFLVVTQVYVNPCHPSPCGPNSQCKEINQQAVCSCLPSFVGSPPGCRPECVMSSECAAEKACMNQKCSDPCPGICGLNANCRVRNHSPICVCSNGYSGDPFTRCSLIPREIKKFKKCRSNSNEKLFTAPQNDPIIEVRDPCYPSPCGQYAECRNNNGNPSCSCMPTYIGSPPNCRPECTINQDCISTQACLREKCQDPCPGSCGISATCTVIMHVPTCTCLTGYMGDPFTICNPTPPHQCKKNLLYSMLELILKQISAPQHEDPCNPSPCGYNAQCSNGQCSCLPEYQGDPYAGCRPECVLNTDCPRDKACVRRKCQDPCPGTCASNAICETFNHIPMCSCPQGMDGNAFVECRTLQCK